MSTDRLTFRDYMRVFRRQRLVGLKLMAAFFSMSVVYLSEGDLVVAELMGVVFVFALLWFPVWRHFAPGNPRRWTNGRPENLYGDRFDQN